MKQNKDKTTYFVHYYLRYFEETKSIKYYSFKNILFKTKLSINIELY